MAIRHLVAVLTLLAAGAATAAGTASAAPSPVGLAHRHAVDVCPPASPGSASCDSKVLVDDATGAPAATTGPAPGSYGPADLHSAYALPATGGAGQTIAIVDAYDDPNAAADLAVYRSQYGLPACTAASGCFRKVGGTGTSKLPRANSGWAQEISLDLDMASAICPACKILLVETSTASLTDLGTGVNTAVRLGATVVSNSYGGSEYSSETSSDAYYNHPGVPITVSSGDSGYGVQYPAASRYVTAVGGTSLTRAANARGWTESAWSGAGSGCSAYEPKPAWQQDAGCARRTVADVAAVADPSTGVAVYDTYGSSGGWLVFGGTSVAAPVVAGVYALAGNGSALTAGSSPYAATSALDDVTSGSNGSCGGSYLCTAVTGYDGPTGLGTPNGTAAF
ncbi:peptidase S8 [Rhodococcus aerolatus]